MRRSGLKGVLALVLAFSLTACAGMTRYDAAGDIHAFLVSIRDGDQAAFDAHVDRPALKKQMKARFVAAAEKKGGKWGVLGSAIAMPLLDWMVDEVVQPEVFRGVAESLGYSTETRIPSRVAISGALKPLDADRICVVLRREGPCVLVFRREGETWRLVAFEGDVSMLRGEPKPH